MISRALEPKNYAAEYQTEGGTKVWYSVTTFKTEKEAREEFESLKESADINRQAHKTLFEDAGDEFVSSRKMTDSENDLLQIRRLKDSKNFYVYSKDHQAARKFDRLM